MRNTYWQGGIFALALAALVAGCSGESTSNNGDSSADTAPAVDGGLDVASQPDATTGTDVQGMDVQGTDAQGSDVVGTDTVSPVDVANDRTDPDATATCLGRPADCVSGTPGGTCGDALVPPNCVGGSWVCPSGTIPITECGCVGRPPGSTCMCVSRAWVCSDAGTDAMSSDVASDAAGARTFACGPMLSCAAATQYCQETQGGAAGSSPRYACQPFPDTCRTHDCTCFTSGPAGRCSADSAGNVTVVIFAP